MRSLLSLRHPAEGFAKAERHEPSTSNRRWRKRAAALAVALGLLLPTAAAAGAGRAPAGAHRHPRPALPGALNSLLRSGAIQRGDYDGYLSTYARASGALRKLTGTRRDELAAVLANVEAIARAGELTASRVTAAFLTLRRNQEWWTAKPLLGAGQRVGFAGSRLVWEHYAGQGLEIQWLATFGQANGYYLSHDLGALKEALDEAIGLAAQRAGGIAWEYLFRFDGGSPPWTSALSQGTALQALARAWSATGETRFLTAAQQALGAFQTPPPQGVLLGAEPGAWYAQYSFAPDDRIVNGFIQSLVGLYDYTRLTGDPLGQRLFEAGDEQARAQLARYDTGAWSMYDQHVESDLSYHELLTEFLEHLCQRTREGPPLAGRSSGAGGAAASAGGASQTTGVGPIAGDEVYCATAARFRTALETAPVVQLLTGAVNANERAGVQVKLSKIATLDMTIALGEKSVWHERATVEGGTPRLLWATPPKAGVYRVTLRARDLAGNEAQASGSIVVRKAPRHAGGHHAGDNHASSHRGRAQRAVAGRHRGRAQRAVASRGGASEPISPPARRLPAL